MQDYVYNQHMHGVIDSLEQEASVIYSAAMATTNSRNKQVVCQIKHAWLIRWGYGFQTGWGVDMLCDIWLAWGFQVNFMYESVH